MRDARRTQSVRRSAARACQRSRWAFFSSLLLVDPPRRSPGPLRLPAPALRLQPARPRSCGWLGGVARPWPSSRLPQQLHKPLKRILAIRALGTKASGLDAQHAISPDSSARQTPYACANILRQGGAGEDIESKTDSRGHLVDVLPSRPRGANEVEMNLAFVDGDAAVDLDHFRKCERDELSHSARNWSAAARCSATVGIWKIR